MVRVTSGELGGVGSSMKGAGAGGGGVLGVSGAVACKCCGLGVSGAVAGSCWVGVGVGDYIKGGGLLAPRVFGTP